MHKKNLSGETFAVYFETVKVSPIKSYPYMVIILTSNRVELQQIPSFSIWIFGCLNKRIQNYLLILYNMTEFCHNTC